MTIKDKLVILGMFCTTIATPVVEHSLSSSHIDNAEQSVKTHADTLHMGRDISEDILIYQNEQIIQKLDSLNKK